MQAILPTSFGTVWKLRLFRALSGIVSGRWALVHRPRKPLPMTVFGRPIAIDRALGTATVSGLTLAQAQQVLDWLETRHGERGETWFDGSLFVVRWHSPDFRRRALRQPQRETNHVA